MRNEGSLNRVITVLCGISLLCVVVDKSFRDVGWLFIDSFVFGIFNERGGWYGICVEVNNGCGRGGGYVIKRC